MENHKKFKTKTGFCHILNDKIILTSDGNIDDISKFNTSNTIKRNLIFYGISGFLLIFLTYTGFKENDWFKIIITCSFGIYLIYVVITSINYSNIPVINRDRIKKVTFYPAKKFLTRAYFKVDFENDRNKIKSRLIMLPGSLSSGLKETNKAYNIMCEQGLIGKVQ
jgi:hypothetical protein